MYTDILNVSFAFIELIKIAGLFVLAFFVVIIIMHILSALPSEYFELDK